MRRTLHKWFWAWDFDKEEKWLNKMSAKGLHLVSVGFCTYVFEEGNPGDYTIRLELLDHFPTHPESERYIKFVEDTGAEYLGSVMRWVYFRKRGKEAGFDLYSDMDSRIRHLNRILCLLGVIAALEFGTSMSNLGNFLISGVTIALFASVLCFILGSIISYGFLRIYLKRRRLKRERALHE